MTDTMENMAVGESPFSRVSYEPACFIWPHFVATSFCGFYAASRTVRRQAKLTPG